MFDGNCTELGLPKPLVFETQVTYLIRCLLEGHTLDTRMARYIGIGNLHSLIPVLRKKKIPFVLEHKQVLCPFTGKVPPQAVDVIHITEEQRLLLTADEKHPQG